MTRLITTVIIGTVVCTSASIAQLTAIWQKSSATGNIPSWFSTDNSERCLAYSNAGGKGRVFVVKASKGGSEVVILDAATGDSIGALDTTGVSGGTFPLDDIKVSSDGVIFAGNLTVDAQSSAFKVYRWADDNAKPSVVISYSDSSYRLGDHITLTGSTVDNSVTIWAGASLQNSVIKFTTMDHGASFTPQIISLNSPQAIGTFPKVYPAGDSFFVSSAGVGVMEFDGSGNFIGTVGSAPLTVGNITYLQGSQSTESYIMVFSYSSESVSIYDVTFGISTANLIASTPALGTAANGNGTGDVAAEINPDGTVTVFVIGTNNGIGAYAFDGYPPSAPAVLTPNGSTGVPRKATMTWNSTDGATSYQLQVAKSINFYFSTLVVDTTLSDTSVHLPTPLAATTKFYWRVTASNTIFTSSYSSVDSFTTGTGIDAVNEHHEVPEKFALFQNYPDPFNPSTTIKVTLANDGGMSLEIYNLLGQLVMTVDKGERSAGDHFYNINMDRFPSGVYFYRLQQGANSITRKMILTK